MHTNVGGRKADLPREVGSQPEGKVNAMTRMQDSTLNKLRKELANESEKKAC